MLKWCTQGCQWDTLHLKSLEGDTSKSREIKINLRLLHLFCICFFSTVWKLVLDAFWVKGIMGQSKSLFPCNNKSSNVLFECKKKYVIQAAKQQLWPRLFHFCLFFSTSPELFTVIMKISLTFGSFCGVSNKSWNCSNLLARWVRSVLSCSIV